MSSSSPLSDEEAADIAIAMTTFEREAIKLCSKEISSRYPGISKKINADYEDVQDIGRKLQDMRLAYVDVIPYNGSAIFLNDRGEAVKRAVLALDRVRDRRKT